MRNNIKTFSIQLFKYAFLLALLICAEKILFQRFTGPTVNAVLDVFSSSVKPLEDRSAVVIFNGENPEINKNWPLDYSRWERVALAAWCGGTRALVFDIGFAHPGTPTSDGKSDSRQKFASTLMALSGLPDVNTTRPLRESLFHEYCTNPGTNMTPETKFARTGPDVMPVFVAPVVGGYDITGLDELAVKADWNRNGTYWSYDPNNSPIVGWVAAKTWCNQGGQAPGCATITTAPREMILRDTVTTPVEQTDFSFPNPLLSRSVSCIYRGGDKLIGFIPSTLLRPWGLGDFLLATFRYGASPNWSTCPPVPTITQTQLDDPRTDVASFFGGRIVFVGAANLSGLANTVDTVMHKALPGVMVHALAADTYLMNSVNIPMPSDIQIIIVLVVLLPVLFFLYQFVTLKLEDVKFLNQSLKKVLPLFLCLITILGCVWFAICSMAYPLIPMLGWAALVFIVICGKSFDPADWFLNSITRKRDQVSHNIESLFKGEKEDGKP